MFSLGANLSLFQSLQKVLENNKPGLAAQLKMCPDPRLGTQAVHEVDDSCVKAGVLLLLYPIEDQLHLVLTRRTDSVENHRGQISLPGGRKEPDESVCETAFRETHEELGVPLTSIHILGVLTPLYIPPSQYCIYPAVAFSETRPMFYPSQDEVAEVLEVPLQHLLDSSHISKETWIIRERETLVPFYAFKNHKIWGATAMVLAEFLTVVERVISGNTGMREKRNME